MLICDFMGVVRWCFFVFFGMFVMVLMFVVQVVGCEDVKGFWMMFDQDGVVEFKFCVDSFDVFCGFVVWDKVVGGEYDICGVQIVCFGFYD